MSITWHAPRSSCIIAWAVFIIFVLCCGWPASYANAIIAGTYPAFRDEFIARYIPASEKVREEQREKWKQAAKAQPGAAREHCA